MHYSRQETRVLFTIPGDQISCPLVSYGEKYSSTKENRWAVTSKNILLLSFWEEIERKGYLTAYFIWLSQVMQWMDAHSKSKLYHSTQNNSLNRLTKLLNWVPHIPIIWQSNPLQLVDLIFIPLNWLDTIKCCQDFLIRVSPMCSFKVEWIIVEKTMREWTYKTMSTFVLVQISECIHLSISSWSIGYLLASMWATPGLWQVYLLDLFIIYYFL